MNALEPPVKQTRSRRKTNYKGAANKKTSGLVPKTDKQKEFLHYLKEYNQVFVLGPAGTGKTYVTATYAADLYTTKEIDKIVITRPHVAVGKDIGFLPGSLEEKVYPWALPVLDVLEKHWGKGTLETAIKNNNVEMAPLALMRGRSFDNAFIIVDETQNITFSSQAVSALKIIGKPFSYVNIFEDSEIREGLKIFSNWPTFPQLYVNGDLVGGCDIMMEMYETGELSELLEKV